ncbi:MAG: hypothetical protein JWQ09_45 [Segetibacter sp.]|nr:hypothetical protein [Segetibacter sp.]
MIQKIALRLVELSIVSFCKVETIEQKKVSRKQHRAFSSSQLVK